MSGNSLSRQPTPSKAPDVAQVLLSIPLFRALALIAVWMDSQSQPTLASTRPQTPAKPTSYFEGVVREELEEEGF